MRNTNLFLLSLYCYVITIVFFGCKKPEKQDDVYKGTATAIKNDMNWNAECTSIISSTNPNVIYLYIDRYNNSQERREAFVVSKIEMKTGVFTIVNGLGVMPKPYYSSHYSSFVADGDAIDGDYFVLDPDSNYIEIIRLDLNTKDIVGRFNITFVKDTTFNVNPNLPDTIRFTAGEFQTKIQEN